MYIRYFSEEDDLDEGVKTVTVVRDGKRVKKKVTDKDGYKIIDGKEVKMDPKEVKNRKKAQKKAGKKKKNKSHTAADKKRAKSMKKR